MGELVHVKKLNEPTPDNGQDSGVHYSQAVVPTIDIYTARFLFNVTQKMVEDAVDRRISILERNIEARDQEIMRTIRKIQARMITQQNKAKPPWWRRLFSQGK